MIDFKQVLEDSGVPTTSAGMKVLWQQKVAEQGGLINNDSVFSPFWRLISEIVTAPALYVSHALETQILPSLYLQTATGNALDLLASEKGITRLPASKAQGSVRFSRLDTAGDLVIPSGTVIVSSEVQGVFLKLWTLASGVIPDGSTSALILCEALLEGGGANLSAGYYTTLETPVSGISSVTNEVDWLSVPGREIETDSDLRTRLQGIWSLQAQWHTDTAYKTLISTRAKIDPDFIFFDRTAPRGPYTADAYIMVDSGVPPTAMIDDLNLYIRDQGNHGHGDDLMCKAIPVLPMTLNVSWLTTVGATSAEITTRAADLENAIRASFRQNTATAQITRVKPFQRLSMSKLTQELHREFDWLESLSIAEADVLPALELPTLTQLFVVQG